MSTGSTQRWWSRPGCIGGVFLAVVLLIGIPWLYLTFYQGRDISRFTGVPVKVEMPECITSLDQVVSISFHSKVDGETTKDLTYICDGRLYSREFNDFGILTGSVEWTLNR